MFVTRLTRRVSLVEQELLTFPEHLSSPPVFSGVCATGCLALCVCFVDRCFCTFSFTQSVLLRFMDSDYPFGIFKLFWYNYVHFSISSFTSDQYDMNFEISLLPLFYVATSIFRYLVEHCMHWIVTAERAIFSGCFVKVFTYIAWCFKPSEFPKL